MWRAALAIVLGVALAGAAPTVFAQHPQSSEPGQQPSHGSLAPHGADMRAADAQHGGAAHAAAEPHRAIQKWMDEMDTVIASGRGAGLAFAADQNGYPGPLHVLELKDRLKLSTEQDAKVQAMLTAMFAESTPKSAGLLEAEAKLRRLFASGRADEAAVRAAVAEVERARSEVRLVHLMFHLKTRDVLTDEQRRLYHEARWSAPRPMGLHGGGSPGAGAPLK